MVKTVLASVTNENGSVDIKALDAFIADIRAARKEIVSTAKEAEKATVAAAREELNVKGKEYFDSLNEGDTFSYQKADGTITELVKIVTKSNTGKTAAGHLVDDADSKRYPKFYQLVIA